MSSDEGSRPQPRQEDPDSGRVHRGSAFRPGDWILEKQAPLDDLPEAFVDDEDASRSQRMRAEGRSLAANAVSICRYLAKYRTGRPSATSAILAHFNKAREHVRRARTEPRFPGAESEASLGLVGDIMWIRRGWKSFASPELRARMDRTDVWLGNLETPIRHDRPVPSLLPDYVRYNAPRDLLHGLRRPGGRPLFAALSLANNHILDQGDDGAVRTLEAVEGLGILPLGVAVDSSQPRWGRVEVKGVRIGVYAATWGVNDPRRLARTWLRLETVPGLAPVGKRAVDLTRARAALAEMTLTGMDFRVVLLHWGHEYERYPDPLQLAVARELCHAGADLVAGAHSHVPQPPEIITVREGQRERRALVLYSLGNFASAMWTLGARVGLLETVTLRRRRDGGVDWELHVPGFVVNQRAHGTTGAHCLRLERHFLRDPFVPMRERIAVARWVDALRVHAGHLRADVP
jgi:hypothetical protein